MRYVPLPIHMIELGKPIPIDVWAPSGKLLLKRGQTIISEQHKEVLHAHQASTTASDANAWQKSYERTIRAMLKDGVDTKIIARTYMPAEIWESDYGSGREASASWMDLREILLGLLYQGPTASSPLARLEGIELRALDLLDNDPEECLFVLFQALADLTLGYSATHALLSAVVCELTTEKLGLPECARRVLFRSALTMNIGMARAQGTLAQQHSAPNEDQRKLIKDHPPMSFEILQSYGVEDEDHLDIVHWHHELNESSGLERNLMNRRILRMADSFVAKMAPRKTRQAMSPLGAAKSLFLASGSDAEKIGSAMASAIGFYPPGTYVQLANGEKAVSVARGLRATHPHVLSIINAAGMPLSTYLYRDTADAQFAIRSPVNAESIKVKVSLDKAMRTRKDRMGAA